MSKQSLSPQAEPIAVVGISCRFPGGMNTLESFWEVLVNKKDVVGEFPKDRISNLEDMVDPGRTPGKIISRSGGFLDQVDQFDAKFFKISPREVEKMDPQQRILLELTYEALEDAGVKMEDAWGSRTGVFAGVWTNDYEHRMLKAGHDIDVYATTGTGRYGASGRISYMFNFQGPCMTLDTACSSSIVAVHLAAQSLLSGESDLALAGAANLIMDSFISVGYSRSGLLAPYGRCRFGSQEPRGYVRSEGAAVVLMKRLSQAVADGDEIYALVTGTACNSDGQSHKYMLAPSFITQETLIRDAIKRAGIRPKDIQYVEAHGTGTKAGDPAELKSIPNAIMDDRDPGDRFYVGSIKTNIGHTEAAAGLAALIKTTLAFQHRIIPASLHSHDPVRNPDIPWEELPLEIPADNVSWPHPDRPLIAGVNSFGISGINAHVIMQEAPALSKIEDPFDHEQLILPVSAASDTALSSYVKLHLGFLQQHVLQEASLRNWIKNIAYRKSDLAERVVFIGKDSHQLAEAMQAFLSGTPHDRVVTGQVNLDNPRLVAAVCPGQGSQWPGMGKELFEKEPVFRQAILDCEHAFASYTDWKLTDELFRSGEKALSSIDVIQPAIVAIEVATAKLLESWGLGFDAVVGHSMGEAAAAFLAGAISLDDMANIICTRSKLMRQTSGHGAMGYIALPADSVAEAIKGKEGLVGIGVVNSPQSAVISGDPATVDNILAEYEARGVFCRRVKVDVASHSPQMDPLISPLQEALKKMIPGPATRSYYSTVSGGKVSGEELGPEYWGKNLRSPVRFGDTVQAMLQDGCSVLVECSPHPVLVQPIQENIQSHGIEATATGSLVREQPESLSLARALAQAWCGGARVQWKKYYGIHWERVTLPLYPWEKERYWFDESQSGMSQNNSVRRDGKTGHPLLLQATETGSGTWVWETAIGLQQFPYLAGHKVVDSIVFPAAGYLEMIAAATEEAFGPGNHLWEDISLATALPIPEKGVASVQVIINHQIGDTYQITIRNWVATENGGEWQLLVNGSLTRNVNSNTLLPEAESWKKFTPRLTINAEQHYQSTVAMQLPYEGAFTCLQKIERSDDILRATISLDNSIQTGRYFMHPALLDGAIQAMLQPMYARFPERTIVPVRVGKWRQLSWNKGLQNLQIVIRLQQADAGSVTCDAALYEEKGALVAEWTGFALEAIERSAPNTMAPDELLYITNWHPVDIAPENNAAPQTMLLFMPDKEGALAWQKMIGAAGHSSIMVFPGESFSETKEEYIIRPDVREDHDRLWNSLKERAVQQVVFGWPMVKGFSEPTAAQQIVSVPLYKEVQAISSAGLKHPPRLWVVSAGGRQVLQQEPVDPISAPAWGMVNVLLNEHPELQPSRIDLPASYSPEDVAASISIMASSNRENELALRNGLWMAARLEHYSPSETTEKNIRLVKAEGKSFTAVTTRPGLLEDLTLVEKIVSTPAKGEVKIEIEAAGINFMNLMSALGIYPGKPDGFATLGLEFAGKITEVGEGVSEYKPGDHVLGMGYDTVASHILVDARKICRKPAAMDTEDAAGIPVVYLTCWYALVKLAHLAKGEKILIHTATGGVGLAAIHIARHFGAEIFATAGSEEKRALLLQMGISHIYDSRSLGFYEQIMADTGGDGVDVVLNSLTGEAMHRSMQLLRKFGRFLEIGKKDVYGNSRLGMEAFSRSLSYHMIDLEMLSFEKPQLIGEMLGEVMALFEKGYFAPLPKTVFPLSDLKNAFDFMSKSKHVGKIIIDIKERNTLIEPLQSNGLLVRPDATYLLTGGYGGLGLTFSGWLIEKGARHLILTGRSGPKGLAAELIESWRNKGVQIEIAIPDLANKQEVTALVNEIPSHLPLKGVMHLAGLLDDAATMNITDQQYKNVLTPKVAGAWNLHEAALSVSLDWWAVPSSSTILFGSPGQAAYVAANSFLDALAQYRRHMGLPAYSVQWGTVSGVGLAAAESNRLDRLAEEGVAPLDTETCIKLYEKIATQEHAVVGAFSFDLGRWENAYGTAASNPFFSLLRSNDNKVVKAETGFKEYLLALPDQQERLARIEERLREKVGQVVKMDPEKIGNKTPFKSLGIDSLMSIQLKNQLEKVFDITLSVTSFWTYANIRDYSVFLAEEIGVNDSGEVTPEAPYTTGQQQTVLESDNDMPDMNELSSDDLSKLLEEELRDL